MFLQLNNNNHKWNGNIALLQCTEKRGRKLLERSGDCSQLPARSVPYSQHPSSAWTLGMAQERGSGGHTVRTSPSAGALPRAEEGPERSGMRGKFGKQGGNSCLLEAPWAFASLAQLQILRDPSPWRKTIRKAQLGA